MSWEVLLALYLVPLLTILGYVLRIERRLSRIEGALSVILQNCGGDPNAEEKEKGRD